MSTVPAYMELIDFIAGGTTPESVIDFRPSAAAQARIAELTALQRADRLSTDEATELEEFLQIEHIMIMAKARARQHTQPGE